MNADTPMSASGASGAGSADGASGADGAEPTVTVIPTCGNHVTLPLSVAVQSAMLRNLIADVGLAELSAVPLAGVEMGDLQAAVRFMTAHRTDMPGAELPPLENFVAPVLEGDDVFLNELDVKAQLRLLVVANYMDIERLMHLLPSVTAQRFRGKTPAEIRAMFNVDRPFTDEEIEAVLKENEWAREPDIVAMLQ